ncbi:hypothetical protein, partial [Lacticaseibacillus paracasei]|uniref:hypothetical protein n=1 Tax=Lacticaseibacillus paracasei TaxID=1597 RepID=UPI001CDCDCF0
VFLRYPKRAYTFSVDYFSTPESVDPQFRLLSLAFFVVSICQNNHHLFPETKKCPTLIRWTFSLIMQKWF